MKHDEAQAVREPKLKWVSANGREDSDKIQNVRLYLIYNQNLLQYDVRNALVQSNGTCSAFYWVILTINCCELWSKNWCYLPLYTTTMYRYVNIHLTISPSHIAKPSSKEDGFARAMAGRNACDSSILVLIHLNIPEILILEHVVECWLNANQIHLHGQYCTMGGIYTFSLHCFLTPLCIIP